MSSAPAELARGLTPRMPLKASQLAALVAKTEPANSHFGSAQDAYLLFPLFPIWYAEVPRPSPIPTRTTSISPIAPGLHTPCYPASLSSFPQPRIQLARPSQNPNRPEPPKIPQPVPISVRPL